jgi:hypothetical protein
MIILSKLKRGLQIKIMIPRLRVAGILWTLVIDLGKLIIPRLRVVSLGIIIFPKSITDVYNIPATLSLGIIILPKSITLRVAGILWTLVTDLGKIIIPRLRVASIL